MSRLAFVPTLVDAGNINAQILNARAILRGWDVPGWRVAAHAYYDPDQRVVENPRIAVTRLWRRRAWPLHLFLRYLRRYDLIFYPGMHAMDLAGLRWRQRLGMPGTVISTLEALAGNASREAEFTARAGHPVFCQPVSREDQARLDELYRCSDHIISISPFMAKMEEPRYGNKFSVLPLGIDAAFFYSERRAPKVRARVVSAGSVTARKRPEMFLELARRHREADFVWYGEGDLRAGLIAQAAQLGANNLSFPGALPPRHLGEAFRAADLFVMPSNSEGVPKVTQEAAACGLGQVIFGYYEAPSVVDGQNGFVVWNDAEFMHKVGELLDNPPLVESFGKAGAEMARAWDWTVLAKRWRERLIEIASRP